MSGKALIQFKFKTLNNECNLMFSPYNDRMNSHVVLFLVLTISTYVTSHFHSRGQEPVGMVVSYPAYTHFEQLTMPCFVQALLQIMHFFKILG